MRPYSPNSSTGRAAAGDDVHHKTADVPKSYAKAAAKPLRHAARQEGGRQSKNLGDSDQGDESGK